MWGVLPSGRQTKEYAPDDHEDGTYDDDCGVRTAQMKAPLWVCLPCYSWIVELVPYAGIPLVELSQQLKGEGERLQEYLYRGLYAPIRLP